MTQIAALYVAPNGSYINVPGVDPWPEDRDARLYRGPHRVVAHPPCQRWGKFWAGQPLFIKQTGIRKVKGSDGGCFKHALWSVRLYGGVLEHPCDSHAWEHFSLNRPPRSGGWIKADDLGGWTCCVEQGRYGHYARKPTWLLVYDCELPELDWGISEAKLDPAIVARMGFKRAQRLGEVGGRGGGKDSAPRIGTPIPFRDLLLSIARTAKQYQSDGGVEGHAEHASRSEWGGGSAQVKTASAVSAPAKAGRVRDDGGASPSARERTQVSAPSVKQLQASVEPGPSDYSAMTSQNGEAAT